MFCMKCGREAQESQAFCKDCLEIMAKYPVKPGTSIQLPRRNEEEAPKKPSRKKHRISQEEIVARQKLHIRRLTATVAILSAALLLAAAWLVQDWISRHRAAEDVVGKNYTVQTDDNETVSRETN